MNTIVLHTPSAFITKNKQRVKQFDGTVYLDNMSEFEIELYNPKQVCVLAKILINGNYISQSGIIIRPGERIFLDRFIDSNNKFIFNTYTIDDTIENRASIAKNGNVTIEFYDEYTVPIYSYSYSSSGTAYIPYGTLTSHNSCESSFSSSYSYVTDHINQMETGRVEKGERSNQEFSYMNMSFNSYWSHIIEWKILPYSKKPITKGDLIKKCPKCSAKIKKSNWTFCPECGRELKRIKSEIIYTTDVKYVYDGKQYLMSTYNGTLVDFLNRHENKLIVIKIDSLTENSLKAIVID